jgi:hypothetical protein
MLRLQIKLLTLFSLQFVVGFIMYLNIRPNHKGAGWPLDIFETPAKTNIVYGSGVNVYSTTFYFGSRGVNYFNLCIDIVVGLMIVLMFYYLLEGREVVARYLAEIHDRKRRAKVAQREAVKKKRGTVAAHRTVNADSPLKSMGNGENHEVQDGKDGK